MAVYSIFAWFNKTTGPFFCVKLDAFVGKVRENKLNFHVDSVATSRKGKIAFYN